MYPLEQKMLLQQRNLEENKEEIEEEKKRDNDKLISTIKVQMQSQEESTNELYDYLDDSEDEKENQESALMRQSTPIAADEQFEQGYESSNSDSDWSKQSDSGNDLKPEQKIELWKKLKDLMLNQLREERQVGRAKEHQLQQQHKTFYKVHLPGGNAGELDKFKAAKDVNTEKFMVHMVFSKRNYDKKVI